MLFTKSLITVLSLAPIVFSAPTLMNRQSNDDTSISDTIETASPAAIKSDDPLQTVITTDSEKTEPSMTVLSTNKITSDSSIKPTSFSSASFTSTKAESQISQNTPSKAISSSTSASPSALATESAGLHFTNKFPDQVKNGDSINVEWDGGKGPYILYTILNYPGLSNIRPNIIEESTNENSHEITINVDDSHDKSTVTIGIGSSSHSDQYKRITIPFYK
ncbi:uncharacterized protein L201_001320 [Kwoniella dendrophila CBS 6074]|uniref:Secreted protein n=1 Tax=Kwoniella dendrophila CBS 6074 TaxID=1295534 RepID=A0AAX4JPQ2_9TREE